MHWLHTETKNNNSVSFRKACCQSWKKKLSNEPYRNPEGQIWFLTLWKKGGWGIKLRRPGEQNAKDPDEIRHACYVLAWREHRVNWWACTEELGGRGHTAMDMNYLLRLARTAHVQAGFSRITSMTLKISTRHLTHLLVNQCAVLTQYLGPFSRKLFWVMPIEVTKCHAIFYQKLINVWKITKKTEILSKCKLKASKYVESSLKYLSWIFQEMIFT